MAAAAASIDAIVKTGKFDGYGGNGYKYDKAEDVIREVRTACINNGIGFFASVRANPMERFAKQTSKGPVEWWAAFAIVSMKFFNPDAPDQVWCGEYPGIGHDPSDHALLKAVTQAIKIGLKTAFLLPTTDDAPTIDRSERPERVKPMNTRQSSVDLPKGPTKTVTPAASKTEAAVATVTSGENYLAYRAALIARQREPMSADLFKAFSKAGPHNLQFAAICAMDAAEATTRAAEIRKGKTK